MNKYALIFVHIACAAILLNAACRNTPKKSLQGDWKSKNGDTTLKISEKKFGMDNDPKYAEDYFVKGDTIFTSFQGNQPFSAFIIQKLDEHYLQLLSPDSAIMEFTR